MNIDDVFKCYVLLCNNSSLSLYESYIRILCHDNSILIGSTEIITFYFLKYKVIINMEIRSYSDYQFIW